MLPSMLYIHTPFCVCWYANVMMNYTTNALKSIILSPVVSKFVQGGIGSVVLSTIALDSDQFVDKVCQVISHSYLQTT